MPIASNSLDQMVNALVPSLSRSLGEQVNVFRVMHHGTWLCQPNSHSPRINCYCYSEALQAARLQMGLMQHELARLVGVACTSLYNWARSLMPA